MVGNAKLKGYFYQDILSAYLVAKEIYNGELESEFLFDIKKTENAKSDKFDDVSVFGKNKSTFYQIKYSDENNLHKLTKADFSEKDRYDLALQTLYESWDVLNNKTNYFKICLAWSMPDQNDDILNYINFIDEDTLFSDSKCFKFDITKIWPGEEISSKWRSLRTYIKSKNINKTKFATFLNELSIEVNLPKTSLLENFDGEIDKTYLFLLKDIGIGQYPNNNQTAEDCAYKLCNFIRAKVAEGEKRKITCKEILSYLHIITNFGGIKESFPINKEIITETPERVNEICNLIESNNKVLIIGDPGSGKSWFIDNLQKSLDGKYKIIKHYCYTDLTDDLLQERITSNIFLGSLLAQLNDLHLVNIYNNPNRYVSNIENLNIALNSITDPLLIIIDGLDHIYRVFEQNRESITENEIQIIDAISKIELKNKNIKILLLSQSIEHLNILTDFKKIQLPKVNTEFIRKLLPKYKINDFSINNISLSEQINNKAKGNTLFITFLIEEYKKNNNQKSFDWLNSIPDYNYNLQNYYSYLISKFNDSLEIVKILSCVDYSLTEKDLEEITGLGDYVKQQINILLPILRYSIGYGYSIYHESFKRYIIEELENRRVSLKQTVLPKLILWLENKGFFENIKSYTYLLQYYLENKNYEKIEQYISLDFLYRSLSKLFPIETIKNNHKLLLKSVKNINKIENQLILIQQSQTITIFEELDDSAIGALLLASRNYLTENDIYNFLYPNEELSFDVSSTFKILKYLCLHGFSNINWRILENYKEKITISDISCIIIQLLNQKNYEKLNKIINIYIQKEVSAEFWIDVFDSFEWYYLTIDNSILKKCPAFIKAYYIFYYPEKSFSELLTDILSKEYFGDKAQTIQLFMQLFWVTRNTSEEIINDEIGKIQNRFWFRNWLIYSIKIIKLSQRDYSYEEIINTFSLLISDLDPFKGTPRTCDLYVLENFIHKTYYMGLSLCKESIDTKLCCFNILEKITETQTSFQNWPSGPLTVLKFSEMKIFYLPKELLKESSIENIYYRNSYYHSSSIQFFFYSHLFARQGNKIKAKEYYEEGLKAILTIRTHKDYALTDLISSSYIFQKNTKTLPAQYFYKIERLSYLMQYHTDRSDVGDFPDDWFNNFIQLYPEDSLKYLIYQILNSDMAYGYYEFAFKIFLENEYSTKNPTIWFLLWLSLPLLDSEQSLSIAFRIRKSIDKSLISFFNEWMKNRTVLSINSDYSSLSQDILSSYDKIYGLKLKCESSEHEERKNEGQKQIKPFSVTSLTEAYEYFETIKYDNKCDLKNIQKYILSLSDFEEKKQLIIAMVKKLAYQYLEDVEIIFDTNSDEFLFCNTALFIYTNRGGFEVLTNIEYLEKAYKINPPKTFEYLKEILSLYIPEHSASYMLSSNLFSAFMKLGISEIDIKNLFNILDVSISNRFPDVKYKIFDRNNYFDLNSFSYDELLITLLISRLKTFTGEKNRNIILGLKYIAFNKPELLIKPYEYIFSHSKLLIPSQRAILLQLLYNSPSFDFVSESLKSLLKSNYPSSFFTEDFYIRKICNFESKLLPCIPNRIIYSSSENDNDFLTFLSNKYEIVKETYGEISGFYNEYQKYRHDYSTQYKHYSLRLEQICAPIVNYQDIAYQVVNQRLYEQMDLDEKNKAFNTCCIDFSIDESIQSITSLSKRPIFLPLPSELDNNPKKLITYNDETWVLICASEKQYITIDDYKKRDIYSKILLVSDQKFEQPISEKRNYNEIDSFHLFLLSGFLVNKLGLKFNEDIFTGIQYEKNGEVVSKMIHWREQYMGSIEDGFEIPSIEGNALLVKKELLNDIIDIYENRLFLIQKGSN